MPGEIPTLEQLEKDIVEKPQAEWEQTVQKWYDGQLERIRKGKYDDAAKKRLEGELKSVRDKMVEDAKYAREKHDKKYSEGIAMARSFLDQTRKELEGVITPEQVDRQKKFIEARQKAQELTAPSDSFIPDYEGYSMTGEALTDENANNKTRWTLSGYLNALRLVDESKADAEINRAKEIYENSSGAWYDLTVDRSFKYENLQSDMGLLKYINGMDSYTHAQGIELASESMGLLCGYLKIADSLYPAESQQYAKYLNDMLRDMKSSLKYEPAGEDEYMVDFNRAAKQMPALMEIKNPKEWFEKVTVEDKKTEALRNDFDTMKKDALAISEGLKFNYGDAGVRTLLALDKAEIGAGDEAAIKSAKEAIRTEAFLKIEEAYKKLHPELGELKTRIEEIEKKNSTSKVLAENEVTDVKARVLAVRESFDTIELSTKDPLNVLAQISAILVDARSEHDTLKKKMDTMAEALKGSAPGGTGGETPGGGAGGAVGGGPDKYLDKWATAESVYSRFKARDLRVSPNVAGTPFRDDSGKVLGSVPGGTPVPLVELPSRGKKVEGLVFVKVFVEDAQVWVDEGMLEVVGVAGGAGGGESVESVAESTEINEFLSVKNLKAVPHEGSVWYQLGDPKSVPLAPGSQVMSSGNHEVDSLFLQNYVFKKMTPEELAKVNKLFQEARYMSQFSFVGGAKSLSQIKEGYDRYFKQVWEYAGKNGRVPGSLGEVGIAGGAEVMPGGGRAGAEGGGGRTSVETVGSGAEVPPGLEAFAKERGINAESREALVRMARDGEKPEGALFDIWFNNKRVPCRLMRVAGGGYEISWKGGSWRYGSLKEAMIAVNDGILVSGMTYSALKNPAYFKMYESWAGKLKESRMGKTGVPGELQFELDWLGTRRAKGNPVIVARVYSYGSIGFRIYRDDVGLRGEKVRDGFAANFGDLMKQLGHIRRWAQKEDFEKGGIAAAKEYNFSLITDPRHYYAAEPMIGRPVYFGMTTLGKRADRIKGDDSEAANATYGQEVTQLGLDWGGSGAADKRGNGWVNIWVNSAGTLSYTVSCPARGVKPVEKRVASMAEIFRDLAEIRKAGQS